MSNRKYRRQIAQGHKYIHIHTEKERKREPVRYDGSIVEIGDEVFAAFGGVHAARERNCAQMRRDRQTERNR
jgi:hypothetical protein